MTTDRVSGGALLLLALAVAWETRRLPLGTHHGPGPGYFPLLLAGLLALLALLIVAVGGAARRLGTLSWAEAPHALAILGVGGFAALALERLGYRLTVLGLLLFLLGIVERRRAWVTVTVAALVAAGSFWVFHTLLRVQLPRGPFGL